MVELYGSITSNPGMIGFTIHNTGFQHYNLEKMYVPFQVEKGELEDAVTGIQALKIKGCGISSPFKVQIIDFLHSADKIVEKTQSCNTVLNNNGELVGYNTDYVAVKSLFEDIKPQNIVLCGNGGYAKTVKCVCQDLNIDYQLITRANWNELDYVPEDTWIFNATPVILDRENAINASTSTISGKWLSLVQAAVQFKLYTGLDLPVEIIAPQIGLSIPE
jgi:shikimate 5-dehydrogenase